MNNIDEARINKIKKDAHFISDEANKVLNSNNLATGNDIYDSKAIFKGERDKSKDVQDTSINNKYDYENLKKHPIQVEYIYIDEDSKKIESIYVANTTLSQSDIKLTTRKSPFYNFINACKVGGSIYNNVRKLKLISKTIFEGKWEQLNSIVNINNKNVIFNDYKEGEKSGELNDFIKNKETKGLKRDKFDEFGFKSKFSLDHNQQKIINNTMKPQVVLGDPGTGKSTIMIQWLMKLLDEINNDKHPQKLLVSDDNFNGDDSNIYNWAVFVPNKTLKFYLKEGFDYEKIKSTKDENFFEINDFIINIFNDIFREIKPPFSKRMATTSKNDFNQFYKKIENNALKGFKINLKKIIRQIEASDNLDKLTIMQLIKKGYNIAIKTSEYEIEPKTCYPSERNKNEAITNIKISKKDNDLDESNSEENEEDIENQQIIDIDEDKKILNNFIKTMAKKLFNNEKIDNENARIIDKYFDKEKLNSLGMKLNYNMNIRKLYKPINILIKILKTEAIKIKSENKEWDKKSGSTQEFEAIVEVFTRIATDYINYLCDEAKKDKKIDPKFINKLIIKLLPLYKTAIIVDEVTDFSETQLKILNNFRIMNSKHLLFLGDFQQQLNPNGINEKFNFNIISNELEFETTILEKSYRQTKNMVNFANNIKHELKNDAKDFETHYVSSNEDKDVQVEFNSDYDKAVDIAAKYINEILSSNSHLTICILVKEEFDGNNLKDDLNEKIDASELIKNHQENLNRHDKEKIPIYNYKDIKGLEFEVIIVFDCLDETFTNNHLYVSATRAGSQLVFINTKQIPKKLKNLFNKSSINIK